MRWIRISVKTLPESEEAISNLLMEMGSGGVQLEGESTDSHEVTVTAYFPPDDMIGERVSRISRLLEDMRKLGMDVGAGRVSLESLDEQDWTEGWKEFFKPLPVGERILVAPSWEDISEFASRDIVIQIDPGMAFGTGGHSTTLLCLELLEYVLKGGERVVDVGTGSGILSIAAAKLGADEITAIDVDERAIKVAEENFHLNGVEYRTNIICGELLNPVNDRYDIIVSNISSKMISSMIPDFSSYLTSNGKLILSGILKREISEIQSELESHDLVVLETRFHEEWAAILGKTPA